MPRISVVGVDDGTFVPHSRAGQSTALVAVLFTNLSIRGVRIGRITVDGTDATSVLVSMLKGLRFDVVLLSGISFGGFNLISLSRLNMELGKPVIAISGKRPENELVRGALKAHFEDWKDRMRIVRASGRIYSVKPLREEPTLFFEVKGAKPEFARHVIRYYAKISRLPEPIRAAGILAKGLS